MTIYIYHLYNISTISCTVHIPGFELSVFPLNMTQIIRCKQSIELASCSVSFLPVDSSVDLTVRDLVSKGIKFNKSRDAPQKVVNNLPKLSPIDLWVHVGKFYMEDLGMIAQQPTKHPWSGGGYPWNPPPQGV